MAETSAKARWEELRNDHAISSNEARVVAVDDRPPAERDRGLSPGSIRNLLAPVRALLATAFEEGLIRSNPAAGLRIAQG